MQTLLLDMSETAIYWPIALGVGLMAAVTVYSAKHVIHKNDTMRSAVLAFLWGSFMVMLFAITLFSREKGSIDAGIDLTILENTNGSLRSMMYSVENLILFIPFGILIKASIRGSISTIKCILIAFAVSAMIEIIQLMTGRGHCQLEDLFLNTCGGAIGTVITEVIQLLREHFHDEYL